LRYLVHRVLTFFRFNETYYYLLYIEGEGEWLDFLELTLADWLEQVEGAAEKVSHLEMEWEEGQREVEWREGKGREGKGKWRIEGRDWETRRGEERGGEMRGEEGARSDERSDRGDVNGHWFPEILTSKEFRQGLDERESSEQTE
jgi:hypothetical protein